MRIEFGVFDHLDRGGFPLGELYSNRLRIVEAYDAAASTLIISPSTTRRRSALRPLRASCCPLSRSAPHGCGFGPMVYVLPLHEPLRLIEEICMLDQISGGRLELGLGRGSSPFELAYFGVGHLESRKRYARLARSCWQASREMSSLRGEPLQLYRRADGAEAGATPSPAAVVWADAARWRDMGGAQRHQRCDERRRRAHSAPGGPLSHRMESQHGRKFAPPWLAVSRHIYMGESEAEAENTGRRAYDNWYRSNAEFWRAFATESLIFPRPTTRRSARHADRRHGRPGARVREAEHPGNRRQLSHGPLCVRQHSARPRVAVGAAVRQRSPAGLPGGCRRLEHDPEKWVPVFGKDHAPPRR